jgi:hypothetical protein
MRDLNKRSRLVEVNMKLFISLSVYRKYTVGQRVLVKAAKDEWYSGTVTRITKTKVYADLDDGSDVDFSIKETARFVKPLKAKLKKSKAPYGDAEVKALVAEDKVKAKTAEKQETQPIKVSKLKKKGQRISEDRLKGISRGDKVVVDFGDLIGPTVVGMTDHKNNEIGVWRGRGNLVWVKYSQIIDLGT